MGWCGFAKLEVFKSWKSTIGLAAMCYARAGVHIAGGEVILGGVNVRALDAEGRRDVRGKRIAYIAQSAAAAFNPVFPVVAIDDVGLAIIIFEYVHVRCEAVGGAHLVRP